MHHRLGLVLLPLSFALAAQAQPQPQGPGSNAANNSMAAAIYQDHILLRPGDTLSFRAVYRDNVGNTTTPESCPAYKGITDQHVPPRAVRLELDKFSWGGHIRSGQEC